MADIDEILEENSELLMDRIKSLKVADVGTDNDKFQIESYGVIFDKHVALLKIVQESVKVDNDESIQREKLKLESENNEKKLEIEEKRLVQETKKERLSFIQGIGAIAGSILAPVIAETIRQSMHMAVSKMVLRFEETGSITSNIGKAEFRK